MQFSETQNKAAGELVDLIASRLGSDRAVHPETAIASAARLAGSLLLRSFNLNIQQVEPGTVVLSNEANVEGPQLLEILSSALQHFGVSLDPQKLGGEPTKRGAEPKLSLLESLSLLQDDALRIAKNHGLDLKEAAQAAAFATAFIVKECVGSIGGEVGFNVAAYGFIEGSKTAPPAIRPAAPSGVKKPWYQFW